MRPIFHLHIPKTGGQTFAHRIAAALPDESVWMEQGDLAAANARAVLDNLIAREVAFGSAHVTGSVLVDEYRFDVVALVRDPVSHIVSNVLHIRREPAHILHKAAVNLPFEALLSRCADWFFNVQARYLVTPMIPRRGLDRLEPDERWLTRQLHAAAGRVTWLAPTEALNRFHALFAAEQGLSNEAGQLDRNVAGERQRDEAGQIRRWLLDRPGLYAIDSLLHAEAQRRMAVYSQAREAPDPGGRFAALARAARLAWRGAAGSVALGPGWRMRLADPDRGAVHHAGPTCDSEVRVVKAGRELDLCFTVLFVAGMAVEELQAIDCADGAILPIRTVREGAVSRAFVRLPAKPTQMRVLIRAPRIFPVCVFDGDWENSLEPVAYAAAEWRLAELESGW